MIRAGREERDAFFLFRDRQPPVRVKIAGDVRKCAAQLFLAFFEPAEVELDANEELTAERIERVLIRVDDVRAEIVQEARDRRDDTGAIGAGQEKAADVPVAAGSLVHVEDRSCASSAVSFSSSEYRLRTSSRVIEAARRTLKSSTAKLATTLP